MAKSRVTISIDSVLLRRIDRTSKKMGSNRSEFIESAVRESIADSEGVAMILGDDASRRAFLSALAQPGIVQSIGRAMGEQFNQDQVQRVLSFMAQKPSTPKGSSATS